MATPPGRQVKVGWGWHDHERTNDQVNEANVIAERLGDNTLAMGANLLLGLFAHRAGRFDRPWRTTTFRSPTG